MLHTNTFPLRYQQMNPFAEQKIINASTFRASSGVFTPLDWKKGETQERVCEASCEVEEFCYSPLRAPRFQELICGVEELYYSLPRASSFQGLIYGVEEVDYSLPCSFQELTLAQEKAHQDVPW